MDNIKQQIAKCAHSETANNPFAFSVSTTITRVRFQSEIINFLNSKSYSEAVDRARLVYFSMLNLHDKCSALFPVIDGLNIDELYGDFTYETRRLHYSHQANVFLLGLYIYHSFKPLRDSIDLEMDRTTKVIQEKGGFSFKFSGDNPYGEFLYRWRLASLCHDIGTGIQLCVGDKKKIEQILCPKFYPIKNIDQLKMFDKKNLLKTLDKASSSLNFSKYMYFHESHPYPQNVCHDHGIVGSLMFLQLMHKLYCQHRNHFSFTTEGYRIFWHKDILSHSIIQIALAIALHNIGNYQQALKEASNETLFNLQKNPFAWLLKVADLLQEWDKPILHANKDDKLVTDLSIIFDDKTIQVYNFPDNKKTNVVSELKATSQPDIVKFHS